MCVCTYVHIYRGRQALFNNKVHAKSGGGDPKSAVNTPDASLDKQWSALFVHLMCVRARVCVCVCTEGLRAQRGGHMSVGLLLRHAFLPIPFVIAFKVKVEISLGRIFHPGCCPAHATGSVIPTPFRFNRGDNSVLT